MVFEKQKSGSNAIGYNVCLAAIYVYVRVTDPDIDHASFTSYPVLPLFAGDIGNIENINRRARDLAQFVFIFAGNLPVDAVSGAVESNLDLFRNDKGTILVNIDIGVKAVDREIMSARRCGERQQQSTE